MITRERLISIAIKYEGDYNKIINSIKNDEEVDNVACNNAITIFDSIYPKALFNLKDPPFVLFYKGDISLLNKDAVGIVGSRLPCEYSLKATKALCQQLQDKVIISGLAKGIDACAHDNANKTIGILGCGIDYIYPSCNKYLFDRLINDGLIISEYPNKVVPLAYHFPFRNRLIAALSKEIYVMEAHERSGTLTTINEALEIGKEVKVLPFDVFNSYGKYNNYLIQEGASIINLNI